MADNLLDKGIRPVLPCSGGFTEKYRKRASNISLKLFNLVRMGGLEPPTSLRTLAPEFTFFVHITGYKMNSKAIKIDFRAEYPPI
ncbi:hypothetical protein DW742_04945 [Butyricicoccus sp. AM28-25]|nr:hypothetical protein [Butyricicoccus sp. AM28-25]RHT77393.1 hypothetical protein DW742_04945 [Butyricicoccus sp. AM28-25]